MPHRGLLFYANASRGYKSGSFPTLGASRSVQLRPVVQESILAYEVGFKATLLDRTVQFNGAAFYYDYSDKQIRGRLVDPQLGPLNALVNIPASRIQGFEAQINWAPTPALRINTGLTYVDSRIGGGFTNFTQFGALQSFDGEPFPLTPKWQASGDAEYTIPLTDKRSVFLAAGATYQSKTSAAFGEIPILSIKDYALVDLRAGVEAKDGSWRLAAWVKNVGNTFYWNNVVTVIDTTIRYTGMPRTFGATLNLRY
jgi:outer membrane receptor protein involved in Fe transport